MSCVLVRVSEFHRTDGVRVFVLYPDWLKIMSFCSLLNHRNYTKVISSAASKLSELGLG